jgi:hypothetical protein
MPGPTPFHTVVVYESSFGNTKSIAEAIAFGLAGDVELVEANDAPTRLGSEVALLVVGGPTHAFTMSRPKTRRSAAEMTGSNPARIGIREWIDEMSMLSTTPVATFDTKVEHPRLPGSAARAAARRLRKAGVSVVVEPQTFYVLGTPGPLKEGERDRAHVWGARLASLVTPVISASQG